MTQQTFVTCVSGVVGSIVDTELGAHAIVNASNPAVALGSGVSGAIRDACGGTAYQSEVHQVWEDEFDESLEPGDCLVTGPGTASWFRWVLHVPAVDYCKPDPETGKPSGPSRIRACFESVLIEARRLAEDDDLVGELILGTPLLGAGHGGVGVVASLDAMMGALRADVERGCLLAEVRFVVLETHHAQLVRRAAEKHVLPMCSSRAKHNQPGVRP